MERKYRFRVKIFEIKGHLFLKVKPIVRYGSRIRTMPPINFSELNIPIKTNTPQSYLDIGWDPNYFLVIEEAFDGRLGPYSFFGKTNQLNILSILEEQVNDHIISFLKGAGSLLGKEKTFKFEADDGLGCSITRREGNVKKEKNTRAPRRYKNIHKF